MIKKTNIDLSMSPKRKNPLALGVQLSSYDKNFYEFEISFLEKELKEGDTVNIFTVFESSERVSESTTEIKGGSALFSFDTALIDRDEVVTNYIYFKSGDSQAEIGAFRFDVKLSEFDKGARVIAEAYDESYEALIQDFEKELRDYLSKLEDIDQEESIRQDEEAVRKLAETDRVASEEIRETAESERVSNEEERKLNEAERITKDSERDSKIDSKANKSMLLSPKYDLVYDSCVRDVNTPLDAYSVPMESGHYFVTVDERETDTILTYGPEGVILANPSSNNSFSPVLIEDFEVDFPYINVRFNNVSLSHANRSFYIKYLNKQNWIRVNAGTNNTVITTCIDGVETEIGRQSNPLNNDFGERYGLVQDVHISYRQAHTLASPSGKVVVVRQSGRESFITGVPIEVANLFNSQGKVGFDVQGRTEILNFKAGRVR